jgi:hypothetical protein
MKPWFEPNTDTKSKWVIYSDWRNRYGNTPISTWHQTAYGVLFLMHPVLPGGDVSAPEAPQLEFDAKEDAFPAWLLKSEFEAHEKTVFSQNGEDGVTEWIFAHLPGGEGTKKYVEFGVQDGSQCNSRYLLRTHASSCFFLNITFF